MIQVLLGKSPQAGVAGRNRCSQTQNLDAALGEGFRGTYANSRRLFARHERAWPLPGKLASPPGPFAASALVE